MKRAIVFGAILGVALLACGEPEQAEQQQGASFMPGLGATGGILIRTPPLPPPPPPPPPRCWEDWGVAPVAFNTCTADGSYPLNQFNDPVPGARTLCFASWATLAAHPGAPDFAGCTYDSYNNGLSLAFGVPFYVPRFCAHSCWAD